jgi:hypothetical protein
MMGELERIAGQCDGVRCDMAMLVMPAVFERTWGIRPAPFWPKAIESVRRGHPDFVFMAEVYWDLEWALQQQGFDYTYDKRMYDRLRAQTAGPVHAHFGAPTDYQDKLARFLENHDERRAAWTFAPEIHAAAAVLRVAHSRSCAPAYLSPGLRFFHQGQLEGRRMRVSPHLVRATVEAADEPVANFSIRLLAVLRRPILRNGSWTLLECQPARDDNTTWDNFITFCWKESANEWLLVAVNFSPRQSQCFMRTPFPQLAGRTVGLHDLLGPYVYDRAGDDLLARGLFLDLPPWSYHVFDLRWHA